MKGPRTHWRSRRRAAAWIVALALLPGYGRTVHAGEGRFPLRDGDRVALIGAGWVERMHRYGYLETAWTAAYPRAQIQFRNLGWSGDNVWGHARALFDAPEQGWARLERDLRGVEPTAIVVAYGFNEAFQGPGGVAAFEEGVARLLDLCRDLTPRVLVLGPRDQERVGPPFPDPGPFNADLVPYREAMRRQTLARGLTWFDLSELPGTNGSWTDNGIHPHAQGYWSMAWDLVPRLRGSTIPWSVDLDVPKRTMYARGTLVQTVRWEDRVGFTVRDDRLPPHWPPDALSLPSGPRLRVSGLEPGIYELHMNGNFIVSAAAEVWQRGVELPFRAGLEQTEELREAVLRKNALVFHQLRPQNETYLFLFRKHEQGHNAAELAEFDEWIEQAESRIARLRLPEPQNYSLIRQETDSSRQ